MSKTGTRLAVLINVDCLNMLTTSGEFGIKVGRCLCVFVDVLWQ